MWEIWGHDESNFKPFFFPRLCSPRLCLSDADRRPCRSSLASWKWHTIPRMCPHNRHTSTRASMHKAHKTPAQFDCVILKLNCVYLFYPVLSNWSVASHCHGAAVPKYLRRFILAFGDLRAARVTTQSVGVPNICCATLVCQHVSRWFDVVSWYRNQFSSSFHFMRNDFNVYYIYIFYWFCLVGFQVFFMGSKDLLPDEPWQGASSWHLWHGLHTHDYIHNNCHVFYGTSLAECFSSECGGCVKLCLIGFWPCCACGTSVQILCILSISSHLSLVIRL